MATFIPLHFDIAVLKSKHLIPARQRPSIEYRGFLSSKQIISSGERSRWLKQETSILCRESLYLMELVLSPVGFSQLVYILNETQSKNSQYNCIEDQSQQYVWRNACLPCGVPFWKCMPNRGGRAHLWIKTYWWQNHGRNTWVAHNSQWEFLQNFYSSDTKHRQDARLDSSPLVLLED